MRYCKLVAYKIDVLYKGRPDPSLGVRPGGLGGGNPAAGVRGAGAPQDTAAGLGGGSPPEGHL